MDYIPIILHLLASPVCVTSTLNGGATSCPSNLTTILCSPISSGI